MANEKTFSDELKELIVDQKDLNTSKYDTSLLEQIYELNPELMNVIKSGKSIGLNRLFDEAYQKLNSKEFRNIISGIDPKRIGEVDKKEIDDAVAIYGESNDDSKQNKKRVTLEEKDKEIQQGIEEITYLEGSKRLHKMKMIMERERIKNRRIDYLPDTYKNYLLFQKFLEPKRAAYINVLDKKQKKEFRSFELKQYKEEISQEKIVIARLQRDMFTFAKCTKKLKDLEDDKKYVDKLFKSDKINEEEYQKRTDKIDSMKARMIWTINKINPEDLKVQRAKLYKQKTMEREILGPQVMRDIEQRKPDQIKKMDRKMDENTKKQLYVLKREDKYTAKRLREDVEYRKKNLYELVQKYKNTDDVELKLDLKEQILKEGIRIKADEEIAQNFERDIVDPTELEDITKEREENSEEVDKKLGQIEKEVQAEKRVLQKGNAKSKGLEKDEEGSLSNVAVTAIVMSQDEFPGGETLDLYTARTEFEEDLHDKTNVPSRSKKEANDLMETYKIIDFNRDTDEKEIDENERGE